ncbi:MAG: glycosyltransferase family 4 protein [Bryobacteraceae bacterium]|nr:glycosyltransferase family 4 protein [Bryobacteraceae bacterium]
MRVLLSAFSCQPGRGSEPGVGWGVVTQVALRHQAVVLTEEHNRAAIDQEFALRPLKQASFVYLGLPKVYGWIGGNKCLGYLYYFLWQIWALRVARKLHREHPFDLVHHVTFVNSWAPSFLGRFDIPFVWFAGAKEHTPVCFYRLLSWRGRICEALRSLAVGGMGWLNLRWTATRASMVVTSSPKRLWPARLMVKRQPVGALSEKEMAALGELPVRTGGPFRMASIGRLDGGKGVVMGMRAFARLLETHPESEYWIVGDGPERKRLERMAWELRCAHRVKFLGWVPRSEIPSLLAQVDALVHPSLHEQFGYVVLEAMAAGRVVLVTDSGGCGELAKSGGGVVIPLVSPEQVISELHEALLGLALDEERRLRAAQVARKAARELWSWAAVGSRLEEIYRQATAMGSPQPMPMARTAAASKS